MARDQRASSRRSFCRVLGGVLIAPGIAIAQVSKAIRRIGVLAPENTDVELAFWQGMRDLGYVDGKNIAVDRRSAEGDFTRLPALAAEIVKNRPDVIVAIVSAAALAAKRATSTIPLVMVGVGDPVASGLVGNLARPGGNLTGTASQSNAAVAKQFELVRQVLPSAGRAAALWNPTNAIFQQLILSEALSTSARLNILLHLIEVRKREELDSTFATLGAERPDAVVILNDVFFAANSARIADLALSQRLPVFSGARALTEAGILASYGPDLVAIGRRSATYVQRILNGAKPGDLSVELPTKFELVINLRTAKALSQTVPESLLIRADEIIR